MRGGWGNSKKGKRIFRGTTGVAQIHTNGALMFGKKKILKIVFGGLVKCTSSFILFKLIKILVSSSF